MDDENDDDRHPFHKRGKAIKETLYALLHQGPTSWDAIFAAGRAIGVADATMRRAVSEGCNLGIIAKTGGRSGYRYGKPSGPAMVEAAGGFERWFELFVIHPYDDDHECMWCGGTEDKTRDSGDGMMLCNLCENKPDAETDEEVEANVDRIVERLNREEAERNNRQGLHLLTEDKGGVGPHV